MSEPARNPAPVVEIPQARDTLAPVVIDAAFQSGFTHGAILGVMREECCRGAKRKVI